jgi:hypothetical protein
VETLDLVDPVRPKTRAAAVALVAFLVLIPLSTGLLVAASHVDVVQRFCSVGGGPRIQSEQDRLAQDCQRELNNKHSRAIGSKRFLRGAGVVCDLAAAACLVVAIRWAVADTTTDPSTHR